MKRCAFAIRVLLLVLGLTSVLRAEPATRDQTTTAQDSIANMTGTQTQNVQEDQVPLTSSSEQRAAATNPSVEPLKPAEIPAYASFLVAGITTIFTIFLGVAGFLQSMRFRKFKKRVASRSTKIEEQSQDIGARIDKFNLEIQAQERRLGANRRFLEAVLSQHSALLVGIVEGFGTALSTDEARRLKSLIFEAEAALDLFHPDKGEVSKALRRLAEVGSHGSVSSLVQLRNDETADPAIRIRAQEVLSIVKERLRKERESPPPKPNEVATE